MNSIMQAAFKERFKSVALSVTNPSLLNSSFFVIIRFRFTAGQYCDIISLKIFTPEVTV